MGTSCKPRAWRRALCALAVLAALTDPASAQQIVPANFFALIPADPGGRMAVSADTMVFNANTETVIASGNVGIFFQGYRATADQAIYYQRTDRVELVGNVALIDPEGVEYIADRVELTDSFKRGFLEALTVAFPDGSRFSAAETSFDEGVERVYTEGLYAPCGECIGTHAGTIGWTVKAARIVTDETEQTIYFEAPTLALLGVPVLWLPWLTVPSDGELELPIYSYDEQRGHGLSFPLFRQRVAGGTLLLTPTVFSRQGLMLGARFTGATGPVSYSVETSGIYQLDPGAYTGLAERRFRGAVQTSGTFEPTEDWTLGWSYTAFTDPGFLPDYDIDDGTKRNEVYAEYLTAQSWANIRFRQYVPLGSKSTRWASWDEYEAAQDRQAFVAPFAEGEHVVDLGAGSGEVIFSGTMTGIARGLDHESGVFDGEQYAYGYAGNAWHLSGEAGWTETWIAPGGVTVSPYAGGRLDLAYYDGGSSAAGAPGEETRFTATPIAALDVRYPLLAKAEGVATTIEPVGQLVYRGSGESVVGIVNNDAQSLVLDGSNIFSFNRWSGADRQDTGLRANLGVQSQTQFDNGAWINTVIGQSFHLAGENGYTQTDGSTAGIGSGLDRDASYIVAAVEGGFTPYLTGGFGVQYDPETGTVPSLDARARSTWNDFTVAATYSYEAENAALGVEDYREDVGVEVTVPLFDYWSLTAGTRYDLRESELIRTAAALEYDDDYLAFGLGARADGPPEAWADDFAVEFKLILRTGARDEIVDFGYSWDDE
ncbi:LPS-assembly protein LptD [Pelagibacterium xiamenense]|uniref:LPS-assembly protein LptD n=1 Tax=Pelagibacterium xiamenense TaxID=2901140 RepID=UPI001E5798B7|nr:LPS assembly protein LptD [Pelagibacterium xiamenense]MCD7060830.1 LPS assembly protein LptD [Pelagibacterium xiamenense]